MNTYLLGKWKVLLSPALRLSTAAARLIFYIWLAGVGNVELVADLAIINALLGLYIFLMPFDYYASLQKHYRQSALGGSKSLYNHASFIVVGLFASSIIAAGLFMAGVPFGRMVLPVFLLFSFEVVNNEINRLLILKGQVLMSAFIMFVRNGAFPLVIVSLHYSGVRYDTYTVVMVWAVFSFSALIGCGAKYRLARKAHILGLVNLFCLQEVRLRLSMGAKSILATVCVRLHLALDKYYVLWLFDKKTLGYYQVSLSIVSAYMILVDSTVVPDQYKEFFSEERDKSYLYEKFAKSVTLALLAFSVLLLALFAVIKMLPIDLETAGAPTTFWLLMALYAFVCGYAPGYLLIKNDLYYSNALSTFLSLLSFSLLAVVAWLVGLSLAWLAFFLFVSFVFGLFLKCAMVDRFENKMVV